MACHRGTRGPGGLIHRDRVPAQFGDPHSPCQRSSKENINGFLSQYFPNSSNLRLCGPKDLEHVTRELNGCPCKTPDWDTQSGVLHDVLTAY